MRYPISTLKNQRRMSDMFVSEDELRRDYTKGELSEMMDELGVRGLDELAREINKLLAQNDQESLGEVL